MEISAIERAGTNRYRAKTVFMGVGVTADIVRSTYWPMTKQKWFVESIGTSVGDCREMLFNETMRQCAQEIVKAFAEALLQPQHSILREIEDREDAIQQGVADRADAVKLQFANAASG